MGKGKKTTCLVLALLMLTACAAAVTAAGVQTITAQQAHEIMHDGNAFVLLDVRTAAEHYTRRIAGAVNIPYDELAQRAPDELADLGVRILIYCQSGRRSAIAAQALAELYDFGGILDWPYDTVSGEEVISPPPANNSNALVWVIAALAAFATAVIGVFWWHLR